MPTEDQEELLAAAGWERAVGHRFTDREFDAESGRCREPDASLADIAVDGEREGIDRCEGADPAFEDGLRIPQEPGGRRGARSERDRDRDAECAATTGSRGR
jgi:hypothetical protein